MQQTLNYPASEKFQCWQFSQTHIREGFSIGGHMTKEQFLQHLKAYRTYLPRHTLLTLRGQALAGDVDGAARGLAQILKRNPGCVPPSG